MKICLSVAVVRNWRGTLKRTGFEKNSIISTYSAAETNICSAKHKSRFLAERPSFPQTIVKAFFKMKLRGDLPTSEHHRARLIRLIQTRSYARESNFCYHIFMAFLKLENVWREYLLTLSSCLLMQEADFLFAVDSPISVKASWVFPGGSIRLPSCLFMQVFYAIAPVRLTLSESSCSIGSTGGVHHLELSWPVRAQENKSYIL